MKFPHRRLLSGLLCILFLGQLTPTYAQSGVSDQDLFQAVAGMGLALGLEVFAKDHFMPDQPRYSNPGALDVHMRNKLLWAQESQHRAEIWSDRLIYGVSLSSLAWGPLSTTNRERALLINMEVFAINSLVTNVTKILSARERPYKHYGSRESWGSKDYASFFSGHSSVAFSQAVTNAILLSEDYPEREVLIWSSLLGLAGTTAYLRVASDMHYFTDVVVGAAVGSLIAWTLTHSELDRIKDNSNTGADFNVTFKIPLG